MPPVVKCRSGALASVAGGCSAGRDAAGADRDGVQAAPAAHTSAAAAASVRLIVRAVPPGCSTPAGTSRPPGCIRAGTLKTARRAPEYRACRPRDSCAIRPRGSTDSIPRRSSSSPLRDWPSWCRTGAARRFVRIPRTRSGAGVSRRSHRRSADSSGPPSGAAAARPHAEYNRRIRRAFRSPVPTLPAS